MDRKTRKILATKLAVNTPGIMLPDYIYRGRRGKGLIGIESVLRGEQILAWLPQR